MQSIPRRRTSMLPFMGINISVIVLLTILMMTAR